MKVERIMVKDMYYITRETTYRELREMLLETPTLRSYPFVTDSRSMTLLGSVARKYLLYLIQRKLGPEPELFGHRRRLVEGLGIGGKTVKFMSYESISVLSTAIEHRQLKERLCELQ